MLIRGLCSLLVLCTCCAHDLFGQSDYTRHEVGGNFSVVGADTKGAFNNDKSRDALYGFNIQGAYNISRFWGVKADFSYFQKEFEAGNADFTSRLFQIAGGIKLQDNTDAIRFRPFAQALIGVAHASKLPRLLEETSSGRVVSVLTGTGPSLVLGGGLDIRLTRKLELRALQIDYNPVWLKDQTFQNVRLGIGVNFRF
jgi:Outer membrane protein beta-barrel domain